MLFRCTETTAPVKPQLLRKGNGETGETMKAIETMTTRTHFAILELGVAIWNQWRATDPLTVPNLKNTDLSELHLENVNLCRADLRGAKLSKAYLYDADFQGADLRGADLTRALLIGANLHKANLSRAVLKHAYLAQSDLSNANFTDACLQKADFKDALLTESILTNAYIAEAELAASFDLTQRQLNSTKDSHLACLDMAMPAQLNAANVETNKTETEMTAEIATEIAPEKTAKKNVVVAAIVSGLNPQQPKKAASALQSAASDLPTEVFQPATREPKLSRPTLRQFAVS